MVEALIELCYSHPHLYKLCNKVKCIPWQQKCPCNPNSEFQCSLGNCIPLSLKCDGLQQCMYGEDEEEELCRVENTTEVTEITNIDVTESYRPEQTTTEEGLPLPVMVTVVSFSLFIIILLLILLCVYITSRQRKDTTKESQSASQLLRKSYMVDHAEDSDLSDQSRQTSTKRAYPLFRFDRSDYWPVNGTDVQLDYQMNTHEVDDDRNFSSMKSHCLTNTENVGYKGKNMAINPDVEIYNTDNHKEYRADGLGKYTFKPSLNYMKSKSCHDINEKNNNLAKRNNYKQSFPRKNNLPSSLALSNGRGTLSTKFSPGFLCSSTPRCCHKQSVNYSDVSVL